MNFSIPPPFPAVNQDRAFDGDHPMTTPDEIEPTSVTQGKDRDTDDDSKSLALSDVSDGLPEGEKVALALSCRDEGNRRVSW